MYHVTVRNYSIYTLLYFLIYVKSSKHKLPRNENWKMYTFRCAFQPRKLKNVGKIDDSPRTWVPEDLSPSVQELGDLMTQESNYHGFRVHPRIQSAIWKATTPPVRSRGTLDLTRNCLSIILALLQGRDTYQKRWGGRSFGRVSKLCHIPRASLMYLHPSSSIKRRYRLLSFQY